MEQNEVFKMLREQVANTLAAERLGLPSRDTLVYALTLNGTVHNRPHQFISSEYRWPQGVNAHEAWIKRRDFEFALDFKNMEIRF